MRSRWRLPAAPGVARLVAAVAVPHGDDRVVDRRDPGLEELGFPSTDRRQGFVDRGELREIVQRHPRRRGELDLTGVASHDPVGRPDPRVLVDLTPVDDDITRRRPRDEEPRREPFRCDLGRAPVRVDHQCVRIDHQPGFLGRFAHRGVASREHHVGDGIRRCCAHSIAGVDPPAGEHPHPAERDLRVPLQDQRLDPVGSVAEEHDRGRGDGCCARLGRHRAEALGPRAHPIVAPGHRRTVPAAPREIRR